MNNLKKIKNEDEKPFNLQDELSSFQQSFSIQISLIRRFLSDSEKITNSPSFTGTHKEWTNAKNCTDQAEDIIKQLNKTVEELWELSNEYNYYWHFCSHSVYIHHFEDFKKNYLKMIPDAEINEFYEHEMNSLTQDIKNEDTFYKKTELEDFFLNLDYYQYLSEKNKTIINIYNKKKGEFLLSQIISDNCEITKTKDRVQVFKKYNTEVEIVNETNTAFFKTYTNIFNNQNSADLFCYLDDEYQAPRDKTKSIDLFRFLSGDAKNHIICSQANYLKFIKNYKGIEISRITPINHTYKMSTLPTLNNLYEIHQKRARI